MVIERFKPGKAPDVYRRFREHGRMAPGDVKYISSWVDLTDFETVRLSAEAAAIMTSA